MESTSSLFMNKSQSESNINGTPTLTFRPKPPRELPKTIVNEENWSKPRSVSYVVSPKLPNRVLPKAPPLPPRKVNKDMPKQAIKRPLPPILKRSTTVNYNSHGYAIQIANQPQLQGSNLQQENLGKFHVCLLI